MTCLLHVSASARGTASFSRGVADRLVAAVRLEHPAIELRERDLAAEPIPHIDAAFAAASLRPAEGRDGSDELALALSETLIAELEAADILVLSTPMHNFTTPSVVKAWIDHLLRPGRTFRSTPSGKVGLLNDRPAFVIVACGGGFEGGAQLDFFSPYIRYAFKTIGISEVQILRLEDLNRGPLKVEAALDKGRRWIEQQLAEIACRYRCADDQASGRIPAGRD